MNILLKSGLIAGIYLLVGCRPPAPESATETKEVSSALTLTPAMVSQAGIRTGCPDSVEISETIQANGTVEAPPQYIATISAPLGGFVRHMPLLQGSFVEKGQVVVELEHPDYIRLQQEFLQALSRQTFLREDFDRQAQLEKEQVGSRRKRQESEAEYRSTQALVSSLEAQLKLLNIDPKIVRQGTIQSSILLRAPFSGYVRSLSVNLGKHVNANEAMMELVNKQHLHVELQVFEKDIAEVQEGQTIRFSLPQARSGEHTARVELVAKTFDGTTKTVKVHGHLASGFEDLVPGSYVRARIITHRKKVTALPSEALVFDGSKAFVYAVTSRNASGWTFSRIPVTAGASENGYTEIRFAGEIPSELVRKGAYFLSAEAAKAEE
ncbi:MAG: efflux RND transporter periplasmic adaptor subunit [Siphonobacter aquaeclarae]|nr:efflux RND transporter periplasmic adaptor subunit [Siphonobacter aquaeclarae]